MKIKNYIDEELSKKGALFFALIDPLDYKSSEDAIKTAVVADEAGSDVILIGGSTGVQGQVLDDVTKAIKQAVSKPVVLFPGNIGTVTKYADAVYFMSMLNSRNSYWISEAQMLAAPIVKKYGIEPLSVAYTVVEPGGTVGWVGDARLVPRNKPQLAAAYGLAAQYMGFDFFITDAGSNPHNGHIPLEMIKAVSTTIDINYIVAGGIRKPEEAKEIAKAGADIIQVGTFLEKEGKKERIVEMIKALREGAKARV
ncbi:MAG: geranylgeranylglyceryl/heptaprenylglyceryl phosphate synthase [Candidatus Bilamarchaeaceae archaeon]